ncbi:MAG TPA: type I-D CRISPR-associated protein Cas5/Csc1 [Chloroflexi bacterium]|nr:type I-D CRISPR-associated protein Cas5/Csc1 [Chloroflexota bacterium]
MQIYRGAIELLDYVFYATVERGKVYETGGFIHNYALAYALGLAQGETYTYAQIAQEPHYVEELTPLNGCLYLTPGAPQQIAHRLVQWNTIREGYAFPGKEPSVGYPDWGFARVLRPGCRFVFYLLAADPSALPDAPALLDLVAGKTARVRLGKFPGKAHLQLEAADEVVEREGAFHTETLLNWRDLEIDPVVCDVVATSLPTRLLARTHFTEEPYYEARFQDGVVRLPAQMRFLARLPAKQHRKRKK